MNQDTLVLLSGMAPKEPEQWALDEWGAKFEADYPKPPSTRHDWNGLDELLDAVRCVNAVIRKNELDDINDDYKRMRYSVFLDGRERFELQSSKWRHDRGYEDNCGDGIVAWQCWRDECLAEFTRNEWPLLWAKKRMQAAANNQHKADER